MKALTLLIGAALLTSVASIAQTYAQPVRLQLMPLLPLGPLLQPQTTVAAGSTFSVALYADSATQYVNLYAYQFNLKFDPTKLQALEVKEGADFQNTRVSDFIPGFIVNPSGEIKTSFDSLQGKTGGCGCFRAPDARPDPVQGAANRDCEHQRGSIRCWWISPARGCR